MQSVHTPAGLQPVVELVELGDEQCSGTSDLDLEAAAVVRIQRSDGHRHMVDHSGLEPVGPAQRHLVVRPDTHAPPAPRSGERFWDDQIHGDQHFLGARASAGHPYPWLDCIATNRGNEAGCSHHLLNERCVPKEPGVDHEIAVEGVRGHREINGTGVEVDGLGTDENDRGLMCSEGLERVE